MVSSKDPEYSRDITAVAEKYSKQVADIMQEAMEKAEEVHDKYCETKDPRCKMNFGMQFLYLMQQETEEYIAEQAINDKFKGRAHPDMN